MINGDNWDSEEPLTGVNIGIDNWSVPDKEYRLSCVKLYKDEHGRVSGLEVKFVGIDTSGYEPITHLYGRSKLIAGYEEIVVHGNPKRICFGLKNHNGEKEFAYLTFTNNCPGAEKITYKLNSRLVGFNTVIGLD